MPIYEYHCKKCNKNFEALIMKKEETPGCPFCNSEDVQKLMSACGFVSKGSGPSGENLMTRSAGTSGCAGCSSTNCGTCGI